MMGMLLGDDKIVQHRFIPRAACKELCHKGVNNEGITRKLFGNKAQGWTKVKAANADH